MSAADRFDDAADSASFALGTITAEHWHFVDGGIEFEDAAGRFVHVVIGEERLAYLLRRLAERAGRSAR